MEENKVKKENPLIAKSKSRIPGIVFRLPSLGKFYENTNILSEDVIDGEVVVYPMRLRDELRMKAIDAIFQGSAVTDTISYCVPQINDPANLVSEDVDYLLTVIKKLTHGDTIAYKDICFKSSEDDYDKAAKIAEELARKELDDSAREDTYKLEERIKSGEPFEIGEEAESDEKEVIEIDNGLCEFFIPIDHFIQNCKPVNPDTVMDKMMFNFEEFEIESRPITFDQFKDLSTLKLKDEKNMSNEEFVDHITNFSNENLKARIKRVDNIDDPEVIAEWVETLSLEQRTAIFSEMEKGLDWGIDFDYEIECPKCGLKKKTDQSYLNPLYFFLT